MQGNSTHLCIGYLFRLRSTLLHTQKQALMKAQQNQIRLLAENILMYMQAVNHPQLDQVRTILVSTGEPYLWLLSGLLSIYRQASFQSNMLGLVIYTCVEIFTVYTYCTRITYKPMLYSTICSPLEYGVLQKITIR